MTEKRIVRVTSRQVAAAKLRITLDHILGRETEPEVQAIAEARRG